MASTALGAGKTGSVVRRISAGDGAQGRNTEAARRVRILGVPTLGDRLIQQALNQILQPLFDPELSESSFGFRPGRNAHQAVEAAQGYVAAGKRWTVDLDL
jgi:retron-type reverse transcriptase